ncbi:hypothetical protein [Providencia manganoxydans]|uniref:hypothetical protein n=1 Tax=Providencia manganoxydans TaxID=2923283 RepID=UPI0032DB2DB6
MKSLLNLIILIPFFTFGDNYELELGYPLPGSGLIMPDKITWISIENIRSPRQLGHKATCGYTSSIGPTFVPCDTCTFSSRISYKSINGEETVRWSDRIELPDSCHNYSSDSLIRALTFKTASTGFSYGSSGRYEMTPGTVVCARLYGVGNTGNVIIPWDFENYGTPLHYTSTCKYINAAPVPPVCVTSVPNINHGVISRELVAGHVATGQGNINCNKSADVSIYVMYNDPISKTDVMKSPSGSQLSHTLTISLDGKDYVNAIESTIEGGNIPIYISDTLGTEAAVAGEYLGSTVIVFDYR